MAVVLSESDLIPLDASEPEDEDCNSAWQQLSDAFDRMLFGVALTVAAAIAACSLA